jgi:prepilin-type N-terminal cleavage/methylation domain-containing protein
MLRPDRINRRFGIRSGGAHFRQSGFTLIELLVVVAIIALLISILLPSLARAREQAKRAACASQEHQIALGCQEYAVENRRGQFPFGVQMFSGPFGPITTTLVAFTNFEGTGDNWGAARPLDYVKSPKTFYCPAQEQLKYQAKYCWKGEPGTLRNPVNWAFGIGYNFYANHWFGKYNRDNAYHYPTNWKVDGFINNVAETSGDKFPTRRLMVSDIMQDMRRRKDVLAVYGVDDKGVGNQRPQIAFNSHGGKLKMLGGNVTYGDGSTHWRSRTAIEADFIESWKREPSSVNVEHMIVTNQGVPTAGGPLRMNFYW